MSSSCLRKYTTSISETNHVKLKIAISEPNYLQIYYLSLEYAFHKWDCTTTNSVKIKAYKNEPWMQALWFSDTAY